MGHVEHTATGLAPVDFAFDYVEDYRNVPKWMFGIKHFTPLTEQTTGVGARFDTALHLGPTTLHLHAEVIEFVRHEMITLRAVKGIEGTIRWTFAPIDERSMTIGAIADYRVPGGLAGRALDRIIQAFIGPAIRHTEKNLRQQIESAYATAKERG
ncbi:SRPBCC family protein [Nocardia arthritidis]|uniref:SRPBCC family protein n=1 Tax=Nocardia arthritidis TaxID=228602 RepID=A0A6G9YBQ7_9NOCA|nr:SRPBCC family protein [Nocardia arthritidis]QIS10659.1 SRPBCC family protein [Nocardia arthritidis]